MCQLRGASSDLSRYSILNELLSSNQCLFYKASPSVLHVAFECNTQPKQQGFKVFNALCVVREGSGMAGGAEHGSVLLVPTHAGV